MPRFGNALWHSQERDPLLKPSDINERAAKAMFAAFLEDAAYCVRTRPKNHPEHIEAREWLDTQDFADICAFVGMRPMAIREAILAATS